MMFNNRRQSKDSLLLEDLMKLCNGQKLYMNEYSKTMFQQHKNRLENITADPDFLRLAPAGSYCFIEGVNIRSHMDKIEKIILYKWNRHYPADLFFDASILKDWMLKDVMEFKGSSHEKITREVYEK
jgi:hypothetical protein